MFVEAQSSTVNRNAHLPHEVRRSNRCSNTERSFAEILLDILDFIFGCHHAHLSRVFTLDGETYKVCCDCGARFAYSLESMTIERRLPLTPLLTRFRIA